MKLLKTFIYQMIYSAGRLLAAVVPGSLEKRLLIIRIDGVGDALLFGTVLKALRGNYPDYKVTLLVQNHIKSLFEKCPYIDEVKTVDLKKYRVNILYKLTWLLKLMGSGYAVCINSLVSRNRISDEITLYTNAGKRFGWDTDCFNMEKSEKARGDKIYTRLINYPYSDYDHEVKKHLFLIQEITGSTGVHENDLWSFGDIDQAFCEYVDKLRNESKWLITLVPGALHLYRSWPKEKFVELAEKLSAHYRDIIFVATGTDKEVEIINHLKQHLGGKLIDLCNGVDLAGLSYLMEKSDLVIGNETGPMHLAILLKKNTVVLLGGGHYKRFMPYGDENRHKYITEYMDCFQCDWKCKWQTVQCIENISVEAVLDACQSLMEQ